MKDEVYNIISFDFVKDFICDGSYCDSKCCGDWGIEIDNVTLMKYRNIQDKKIKKELKEKCVYLADTKKHVFKLVENGKCPFLQNDYLCHLQKKLGEDYLSDVCATYPRKFIFIDNYITESLSLSCPVVARMLVRRTTPLVLQEYPKKLKRKRVVIWQWPRKKILLDKWLDLQCAGLKILQNNELTIRERLLNLGLFGEAVQDLLNKDNTLQELNLLINQITTLEQQRELASLGNKLPNSVVDFVKDLFMIVDKYLVKKSEIFINEDDNDYMIMLEEYFQLKKENSVKKIAFLYDELVSSYQKYVLNIYPYLRENYIVHQYFRTMMPIMAEGLVVHNIVTFLIYFRIQEMLLMLRAAKEKENLTEKQVVDCISYGAKILEHEDIFFRICSDYIVDRNYTMIDIMRIWLTFL